jgi:hypothetical protein
MNELLILFSLIGGLISLVALITFFVMAKNIKKMVSISSLIYKELKNG